MSSTTIDDQDRTHVTYTGNWIRGGIASQYDGTVSSSTTVGDYFTVKFSGNYITVYGLIDATSGGVLANYSVDGATPQQVVSQTAAKDTDNQQFWRSPILAVGDHNLTVTMAKVNNNFDMGEGTIWFDYFLVQDLSTLSDPAMHRKHIGAIVGGVLGGVFACILVALAYILFRRRQREKREAVQPVFWPKNTISTPSLVEPFPGDPSQDQDLSSILPSHGMTSISDVFRKSASTNPHARRNVLIRNINVLPRSFSPASEPHNAVGKRQIINIVHERDVSDSYNSSESSPMRPWQHRDSGIREVNLELNDAGVNLELPPVYSAI